MTGVDLEFLDSLCRDYFGRLNHLSRKNEASEVECEAEIDPRAGSEKNRYIIHDAVYIS